MTAPATRSPSRKAGMVLFGDVNGIRHVVAPYSEGRFGKNRKYYVLGKGKVDPGEDPLKAAMRECSEESGIDVEELLGEEVIAKLHRGETVEDVGSGYEGVRIKRVVPQALEYEYLGRGGSPHDFALFAIELEGIEHLYPSLKNPHNRSHYLGEAQEVYFPIRTKLAMNRDQYPSMEQCLDWLRTMHMPDQPWAKDRVGEPLPRINGEGAHWFADLEAQYMRDLGREGEHIRNVPEWQSFQKTLQGSDYDLITRHAEQIKQTLTELGVLSGKDTDLIKMDTKDCPLVIYQEGADLLRADNYLKATIDAGLDRSDYNLAFCGNTPEMAGSNKSRIDRICSAQLAGVVWAVGDTAIDSVANHYQKKPVKTRSDNAWLGGDMYDDSLRADLHEVRAQMKQKEVPVSAVLAASVEGTLDTPREQQRN